MRKSSKVDRAKVQVRGDGFIDSLLEVSPRAGWSEPTPAIGQRG